MDWTLERGAEVTGIPAEVIREVAHAFAKADRAMICWTLGITEHHNAADNVLALINLGLLTGHVGTYGSGLNPLRGQNNVQGGGDMGAIPNKPDRVPGGRERCRRGLGSSRSGGRRSTRRRDWHLSQMFEAMEEGELTALYVIGENPAASEADNQRTHKLLSNLDILIVQDIFLTQTAKMADVVLPAANSAFESEGTVTNSERRVQRVRPALVPPGNAKDDIWIISQLANRLGRDWGDPSAHDMWEEVRRLSPMHAGMAWERLEELGGIQWPCPDDEHPGTTFLHARLWSEDPEAQGRKAPFSVVLYEPPVDELDEDYPVPAHHRPSAGLVQHRSADRRVHVAAPSRGDARHLSGGRRAARGAGRGARADLLPSGRSRGPGTVGARPPAGSAVHDVALPGPGRRQQPDDRRVGSEVGDGGVQGHGGAGGEARVDRRRSRRGGAGDSDGGDVDLHLMDAAPSEAERAAVDGLLGPPETGWVGATERSAR